MLAQFGHEIWTAEGSEVVAGLGFRYPTRMAVIRLPGDELFVWSPIALTDGLKAQVDALGAVRHLVAPNSLHHVFIADWKHAYPDARLYAAPRLPEVRKDITFDEVLDARQASEWSDELEFVVVETAITTEVVFFHRRSGAVIFTDLIQQFPAGWFSGWRAIVAKLDLMVGPEPSVPRKFRVAFTNRRAARASIGRILSWSAEKVLMAHGTPVVSDGQAFLRRAFKWLAV
ncbi:MAG TPA: DUF4336 domain-containing protein [Phenylobacterium sp.]|uniref:DUF4336 domain-containing protein n=1 Tax=Phenylobacterium sp. TaxID=1871053 RepID=UPI002F959A15